MSKRESLAAQIHHHLNILFECRQTKVVTKCFRKQIVQVLSLVQRRTACVFTTVVRVFVGVVERSVTAKLNDSP